MSEFDWDAPDEVVVDFEDLEQTEVGTPLKKEPIIAKPKSGGFNINFRDLEDVVSALTAAEMQLQNNLGELKKLDNLASRAKILSELDTSKILEQLEKVGFTQIARKITDSLKTELEAQKKEIYTSSAALEGAAKDLSVKAENLRIVADGFKNLDNMSDDLQEFIQKFKKMSGKNLFLGVIVATITGIFAGGVLSYAYQFGGGDNSKWLEFAIQNNATIVKNQTTGGYSIFLPNSTTQFFLEQNKNGADVLSINPAPTTQAGKKR